MLFSGSIRENIAYGLTGCSLHEIQDAARKANAHDFIKLLKKGYDTGALIHPTFMLLDELWRMREENTKNQDG